MVQLEIEQRELASPSAQNGPTEEAASPAGKWLFRGVLFLILVCLLFLLAVPQILRNSSVKRNFVANWTRDFEGSVEIDDVDFTWWKPAQLSGVKVKDKLGNALADVESAEISAPFWRTFWPGEDALVLKIRKPRYYYRLETYGESNWDALLENAEKIDEQPSEFTEPKHSSQPLQIQIVDGQVTLHDLVAQQTLLAKNIQANVKRSDTLIAGNLQGQTGWLDRLFYEKLHAGKHKPQATGPVQASFQLAMADGEVTGGDVDAEVKKVPLAWLKPWLAKYAPHLKLDAADSDVKVTSQWKGTLQTGLKLAMKGTITSSDVTILSDEWFPGQMWQAPKYVCQFEIDNTLPTTAGKFKIVSTLSDCVVSPLPENADGTQLASQEPPEPPVKLGDVRLESEGVLETTKSQLTLKSCQLTTKTSELKMAGAIKNWTKEPELDFEGTGKGDITPWLALYLPNLQEIVTAKRLTPKKFGIRGTLPKVKTKTDAEKEAQAASREAPPPQQNPFDAENPFGDLPAPENVALKGTSDLEVVATLEWEDLNCYGVESTSGELWAKYQNGEMELVPVAVPIGERGRFNGTAKVLFRDEGNLLIVKEGPILEHISFNKSMTRRWLKYVTPILADATDIEGTFSLDLKELTLDLDSGEPTRLKGTLKIHDCRLGPGPLIRQATAPIAGISQIRGNQGGIRFLQEDAKWVELPAQNVRFARHEDRIYHSQLTITSGKVSVTSTGSVGLDETLHLKIAVPLDLLPDKDGPFARFLRTQPIEIDIQGTLDKPKVNAASLKEFGAGAVDSLIQGIIERRRQRGR